MDPEDIASQIENRLYHLRSSQDVDPCVVEVQVKNVGKWIVKIRNNGVIVNDSNLICTDCVDVGATVIFRTPENFWAIANGAPSTSEAGLVGSNFIHTGDEECVNVLFSLFSQHNSKRSDTKRRKSAKEKVSEGSKSIKSGWLHKKRDIIAGWRHRYFKIYMGRVEYFIDQTAVVPRGVIPLLGADIVGPMRCTINGNDDHWCLTVDPRHRDKSFKLASEQSGVDGNLDIESWIQALTIASRSTENHTGMLTANPVALPTSPARPAPAATVASIPRRIAAAASSLARSTSLSSKHAGDSSEAATARAAGDLAGQDGDPGRRDGTGIESSLWGPADGALKNDVVAAGCVAAIVGANISSGGMLSGSHWTGILFAVSAVLLVKIIYDFYMCSAARHMKLK